MKTNLSERLGRVPTMTTHGRVFVYGLRLQSFAVIPDADTENGFFCIHIPTGAAICQGLFLQCYHCARTFQRTTPREVRTSRRPSVFQSAMRQAYQAWKREYDSTVKAIRMISDGGVF